MRLSWHEQIASMVYEAGDDARADAWYRLAFAAIERDPGLVAVLASCYSRWGFLYESSGHYGRAEAIWKEGLEKIAGREALIADYVSLLQDLSLVRKHYRDEEGAIVLIEQSRVLAAEKLGTDSAEYAVACNNLVLPLNAVGRGEQALKLADEALRIAESHPDREWAMTDRLFRIEENGSACQRNRCRACAPLVLLFAGVGLPVQVEKIFRVPRRRGRYDESSFSTIRPHAA
jgi:tetratricopeptide (TPR) repeat protein